MHVIVNNGTLHMNRMIQRIFKFDHHNLAATVHFTVKAPVAILVFWLVLGSNPGPDVHISFVYLQMVKV